jgi:hypothetical protein
MEEDRAALSPLFSKIASGIGCEVPKCDVLFLYADLTSDGSLGLGEGMTLRHVAARAGAKIAVLASDNASEGILAASRLLGPKQTNLVWTLDRKGRAFPTFFKELFHRMKSGKAMPGVWVVLAPQHEAEGHRDLPETLCQLEAGQVRFR